MFPIIAAALTILGGVILWYLNQREKRQHDSYVRKEGSYKSLIKSLRGFQQHATDKDKIEEFLLQTDLCWLYCSDEVINKAYNFLDTTHAQIQSTQEETKAALGELILEIRKDLISQKIIKTTNLKSSNFKVYKVN